MTSTQSTTEDIERGDIVGSYRRLLPYRLMAGVDVGFLYTTAQRLDLRSSIQPLVGSYLVRTNALYFVLQAGAAFTHENFSTEEPDRRGTEGLLGMELNLFNTGNVGLLFATKAFPSFSEEGRLRIDQRIQFTYDLPRGFYFRTGVTANYDNRAVQGAADLDYAFQTGIGWKH